MMTQYLFLNDLKARDRFTSLKKNARDEVVAELEEVCAFIYCVRSYMNRNNVSV